MRYIFGIAAGIGLCVSSAVAQTEAPKTEIQIREMKSQLERILVNPTVVGFGGAVMGDVVDGAPYSADEVRESTQILGDGTRIHNENKVAVYRDSKGRIRREAPDRISIWDPVSGATYELDSRNMAYRKVEVHIATRRDGAAAMPSSTYLFTTPGNVTSQFTFLPPPGMDQLVVTSGRASAVSETSKLAEPPQKKESLGTRVIEGVKSEGERSTTTIEIGAIGNDRPISSVTERWYSPELHVVMLEQKTDPRTGEDVVKLTNVRRGEPDASLFQVPSGYQPSGPPKL